MLTARLSHRNAYGPVNGELTDHAHSPLFVASDPLTGPTTEQPARMEAIVSLSGG